MSRSSSKSRRGRRRRLVVDTRGSNLAEYVILVGVVSIVALAGFRVFGQVVLAKVAEQSDAVARINGVAAD